MPTPLQDTHPSLSNSGITGTRVTVKVGAIVDKQGQVARAWIDNSSGEIKFDLYAINEVKKMTFLPALRKGQPVAVVVGIQKRFSTASVDSLDVNPEFRKAEPGTTPPKVIHQVAPKIPDSVRDVSSNFDVLVELTVSAAGKPEEVKVLLPSRSVEADQAAIRAVEHYVFEPANLNGQPVAYRMFVQIHFTID